MYGTWQDHIVSVNETEHDEVADEVGFYNAAGASPAGPCALEPL